MQYFHYPGSFTTECGALLQLTIAYRTYGSLNAGRSNAVWICHALTASADAMEWWPGLVGPGCAIDPNRHFIVCANIIGSCYGSTGPTSMDESTGKPYGHSFPMITIRDMVQAHILLRRHLGIDRILLLAGGSMGGYQVLEWAVMELGLIRNMLLLATGAAESAWGIAIHTAQRMAIEGDSSWHTGAPDAGRAGLKAARAIGMLTYRSYSQFVSDQTDPDREKLDGFRASSYLHYQGEKLVRRFNAYSYWTLTKAMDSHNLARGRGASISEVLQGISQPALVISISSDMLCPPEEQQLLAAHLSQARYESIHSPYGHDGFLVEAEKIGALLLEWMPALDKAAEVPIVKINMQEAKTVFTSGYKSQDTMKTKPLGSQGLQASELGLGCMGMSDFYGARNDAESMNTLARAEELGITFWDTADMYGPFHNEELVGKALQGRREKITLATKFGIVRDPANPQVRGINGKPAYVQQACEASLKRLNTEVIDLYYLHRVDPDTPIEETAGAMGRLVEQGKVRGIGFSEVSPETLRRAHATFPVSAVQSEYSIWTRDPEDGILEVCKELGIAFVAYSPLGRGFLTGQIKKFEDLAADDYRRFSPRFQGANFDRNMDLVKKIEEMAARKGCAASQLALAWVMAQGDFIFPIPGTKRIKYLEENAGALDVALTAKDLQEIADIAPKGAAAGARYPEAMMGAVNR